MIQGLFIGFGYCRYADALDVRHVGEAAPAPATLNRPEATSRSERGARRSHCSRAVIHEAPSLENEPEDLPERCCAGQLGMHSISP